MSRVPEPLAHLLLGAAAFGSGACCLLLLCGLLASRGGGREVADSPLVWALGCPWGILPSVPL